MANFDEEVVEGEGEKKPEVPVKKASSDVQIKLAEQAKYVAGKFDILFATAMKIEGDIIALHSTIKANQDAAIQKFQELCTGIQNRVEAIENARAEEAAATDAARRAALGLPPPEPPDPMALFAQLHQSIGALVKSKPELATQAVKKLEETIASLEIPKADPPISEEEDVAS